MKIAAGLYSFTDLVIDLEIADGASMFRVQGDRSVILVHLRVAQAMYEGDQPRFAGLLFKPVDYAK